MLARGHTAEFCSDVWLVQPRKPTQIAQLHHCLSVYNSDPHVIPGVHQLFPLHSPASVGDDHIVRSHFLYYPRQPTWETRQQSPKRIPDVPSEREAAGRIFVSGLGSVCPLLAASSSDELH